jgi:hypothetical protein
MMGIPLREVFEARIAVGAALELGQGSSGRRRIVPIASGEVEGPRLRGRILPGGADWQYIRPDGVVVIEARYTLETHDGVLISVESTGLRHGPDEVMRRLAAGEQVESSSYYFRTAIRLEVPLGPYDWMNRSLFVARGERRPEAVVIRVFEVL